MSVNTFLQLIISLAVSPMSPVLRYNSNIEAISAPEDRQSARKAIFSAIPSFILHNQDEACLE
jgi:hypothetical protein